jgi:hypothetical protein
VPILHRTPLAPITIAVLATWSTPRSSLAQLSTAAECLSILWPLAAAKFTSETLLDCFAAVIHLLNMSFDIDDGMRTHVQHLMEQIIASYRHTLANASNKKKVGRLSSMESSLLTRAVRSSLPFCHSTFSLGFSVLQLQKEVSIPTYTMLASRQSSTQIFYGNHKTGTIRRTLDPYQMP